MPEFNLKEFTDKYIAALKEENVSDLVTLVGELEEANKAEALSAVIERIKEDKDLANSAEKVLGVLETIQKENAEAEVERAKEAPATEEKKEEVAPVTEA